MNAIDQTKENAVAKPTVANFCRASGQKLVARIEQVKQAILAEFRDVFEANEHLLRLALSEAEAIAWQTDYPFLVFPTLATEKAQAVAAWHARQRIDSPFALPGQLP